MLSFEQLDKIVAEAIGNADLGGAPEELYNPIKYMISIGGKRLRPKLCLLTYSLFGGKIDDSVLKPALGLEIFHGFTLIHDDIMDRSALRRGMPTVHMKWNDNIAILSGDAMSILAYKYIAGAPADRLPAVLDLFSTTAAQVCEGQQYDMNYESAGIVPISDYLKMISLKTAVLIACSAKMGAVLAGADEKVSQALYDYGFKIGLAFQIMDDYLDSFGDVAVFGKKIGIDILCNKKNWILLKAMEIAGEDDRKRIEDILAISSEEEPDRKITLMTELYRKLGVDRLALEEAASYHRSAYECLRNCGLGEAETEMLAAFGDKLVNRKK